jgi:hypothetical protein
MALVLHEIHKDEKLTKNEDQLNIIKDKNKLVGAIKYVLRVF